MSSARAVVAPYGPRAGSPRARLLWAIRYNAGATAAELFDVLDIPSGDRNRYRCALWYCLAVGEVVATGAWHSRQYVLRRRGHTLARHG